MRIGGGLNWLGIVYLRDTCCADRRWTELARDRVVLLAVLNLQVMRRQTCIAAII